VALTKIVRQGIADDAIDGTKIADDVINSEHIVDAGIDSAHINDVAATKLTGTIADARLPATLPAKSGVNLTALNATELTSGTLPIARIADDAITNAKMADDAIDSAQIASGAVDDAHIAALAATKLTGTVATARLGSGTADTTTFLRGDGSWQVVSVPKLDSPVITGTLYVRLEEQVTHTISNWSDDVSYTITPTNCTIGSVNASGQFIITSTSGHPSYTIIATTASLGLDDSATVTKNLKLQLEAPTLSSPADTQEDTNLVYTITSTDSNDDKLILDFGASTFTYGSVSHGSGSKVGNTVEVTGFTTNNPAVTVQFTAEATYSVTAKATKIDGSYQESSSSAADSLTIVNFAVSGGAESTSGSYTIHKFTSSATLTVAGSGSIDYLVIAGGGGGGRGDSTNNGNGQEAGGGGGAGGLLQGTNYTINAGSHAITVGNGGAGGNSTNDDGDNGQNSSIASLFVAIGGGGGGGGIRDGKDGGSGGGGGGAYGGTDTDGGSPTAGQGYAGGSMYDETSQVYSGHQYSAAGGGGAAEVGESQVSTTQQNSGDGGAGLNLTITGGTVGYAGGGTGGPGYGDAPGSATHGGASYASAGAANTGGGGGGASPTGALAGAGGSGIVVIRYLT